MADKPGLAVEMTFRGRDDGALCHDGSARPRELGNPQRTRVSTFPQRRRLRLSNWGKPINPRQSYISTDSRAEPKIDHAAIRVPDFDTAVAWYADKLDFRLRQSVSLAGLTFSFLYPAADESFHFELLAGPDAAERPPYKDLHDSYKMSGWHHPGFRVDSVDDTIDELKCRNVTIVSEPHDVAGMGLRVAFFADPWGNLFEVIQSISK